MPSSNPGDYAHAAERALVQWEQNRAGDVDSLVRTCGKELALQMGLFRSPTAPGGATEFFPSEYEEVARVVLNAARRVSVLSEPSAGAVEELIRSVRKMVEDGHPCGAGGDDWHLILCGRLRNIDESRGLSEPSTPSDETIENLAEWFWNRDWQPMPPSPWPGKHDEIAERFRETARRALIAAYQVRAG